MQRDQGAETLMQKQMSEGNEYTESRRKHGIFFFSFLGPRRAEETEQDCAAILEKAEKRHVFAEGGWPSPSVRWSS